VSCHSAQPVKKLTATPEMLSISRRSQIFFMFWALARVRFSAAKIVSCNNKNKFHGLPSKLLQLFYFRHSRYRPGWCETLAFASLIYTVMPAFGFCFALFAFLYVLKKVGRCKSQYETTCSGVSKASNLFLVQRICVFKTLPQDDV
jgi:hypothetical protein